VVRYDYQQLVTDWKEQPARNRAWQSRRFIQNLARIDDLEGRPMAFVARGTHAAYRHVCPSNCHQLAKGLTENPHDGLRSWPANDTAHCIARYELAPRTTPRASRQREPGIRNGGLIWPHCDGFNWPHLRPMGGPRFELRRARAKGARGNGIQGGVVRADQARSRSRGAVDPGAGGASRVHRRAVRQALASPVPVAKRSPVGRPAPKLGAYRAIVDGWLEADRDAPRKQRHTAKRIHRRLVDEHGADVAETTVRDYVRQRRRAMGWPVGEVFIPQVHAPGVEAEVDWGQAHVDFAGARTKVRLFFMRASFSGAAFCQASLVETQQAFLELHVEAFEWFGGAFEQIRFDNLTSAVKQVLRGRRRVETDRFVALRSHYLFASQFTTPGLKGPMRRAVSRARSGAFGATISSRSPRSPTSPSSTRSLHHARRPCQRTPRSPITPRARTRRRTLRAHRARRP
jgi:transposase